MLSWSLMRAFQFVVSVAAAWVFDRTMGDDLTPQAWGLGVLVSGVFAAWLATVVIVRLHDALQRGSR